jgi:SNF2 family DNA or RNA helicase
MKGKPRRSGRERTSTVIQINGHAVLKSNNYVTTDLTYEYGDNSVASPAAKKKRKTTTTTTTAVKPRPTRRRVAEVQRQAHNDAIRKRVAAKAPFRIAHLAKRRDILAPFLEDGSTTSKLSNMSSAVSSPKNTEIFLQPDAIQADMRDYQLAGLNWMVKMHSKNLGMIL